MIQKNEEYLYEPFLKNNVSYQMLTGKSFFDIVKDAKSSEKKDNTPKVYAAQTAATPKSTYSVEERDARVRNAYAKRQAESKRKAEPQVPKQEDDFLKGFWGEREQDTTKKVPSALTKPVHAWEKQNIFASREQTPKFPNTQWRSSKKSPYYGDTPGFQNYSATRPTGDIKTDEELEIFLEGFSDPYGEKKKEEKSKYQKTLDGISTALTAASFIPGLDTFTNVAQIPVDLLRGDFLGAGLDLLGAIPIVGEVADIGKTARTADRIIDTAKAASKADDVVDIARTADATSDVARTVNTSNGIFGRTTTEQNTIKYPGNNPSNAPGKGFEWRGKSTPQDGRGNWYNPKTGEKWNADLNHGDPIGPHWDYTDANGNKYRVFPNGRKEKK